MEQTAMSGIWLLHCSNLSILCNTAIQLWEYWPNYILYFTITWSMMFLLREWEINPQKKSSWDWMVAKVAIRLRPLGSRQCCLCSLSSAPLAGVQEYLTSIQKVLGSNSSWIPDLDLFLTLSTKTSCILHQCLLSFTVHNTKPLNHLKHLKHWQLQLWGLHKCSERKVMET